MGKKKTANLAASDTNTNSDSDSCIVLDTSNSPLLFAESPRPVKPSPSGFFLLNSEAKAAPKAAGNRSETAATSNKQAVVEGFVNEPFFLSHQAQYSEEDSEFLTSLEKATYKGPVPMKASTTLIEDQAFFERIDLVSGLNMEFKWDITPTNSNSKFCDCQKVI